MAECTVFITQICDACCGNGRVQLEGTGPFFTCAMCQGSGRKLIPAPDLLAALKDIENRRYYIQAQDCYLSMPQDIIDQVKKCSNRANFAIRKAEGES